MTQPLPASHPTNPNDTPDMPEETFTPPGANETIPPLTPGTGNALPLDARLHVARPRLLTLARLRGLSDEDAEEVAQETLLTGWRQIATLRDPERFDAWLDGICRTLCLRLLSARARDGIQLTSLSPGGAETDEEAGVGMPGETLADPTSIDLSEELCQEDLHTLLDRALAHLSAPTRAAIVLSYLEEEPQAEVARRLGVSLSALEARLHRARRELRQVLAGPLRAEAESFGLLVGQDEAAGWRESREWCMMCGQHRMRGTFETMPDGSINLRMRCPACSARWGADVVNSYGMVDLGGLRSFRPAITRLYASSMVRKVMTMEQYCLLCGSPAVKNVTDDLDDAIPGRHFIVSTCARCGVAASWLAAAGCARPEAQLWTNRHPRYLILPDTPVTYGGVPAIRVALSEVGTAARLLAFIEPRTLAVLGIVEE